MQMSKDACLARQFDSMGRGKPASGKTMDERIAGGADPNATMPFTVDGRSIDISALQFSVLYNKESAVQSLITHGADVNYMSNDVTALELAVKRTNANNVQTLLAAGADPNVPDHQGKTPLIHCLMGTREKEDNRIFSALIEAGADVNAPILTNLNSPLHLAVSQLETNRVSQLVEAGADVNAQNIQGKTPLHILSGKHQTGDEKENVANILISHGADLGILDSSQRRAEDQAFERGDTEFGQFLQSVRAKQSQGALTEGMQDILDKKPQQETEIKRRIM